VSNINLYNFTRRVPCGVSLSTFELIPAVATAQPGAMVTALFCQRLQSLSVLFSLKAFTDFFNFTNLCEVNEVRPNVVDFEQTASSTETNSAQQNRVDYE